ncbi:DNA internalization-related competence protein ComEC/Rec2 [Thiocystis violacea]|nr:DNA internalization-related competence protein ComEC/Rec2 [Thiocystis violacea]MBK1719457.1 DNA internalization-related competence protein ComEC/Rec2 [Thiocystis violacea]
MLGHAGLAFATGVAGFHLLPSMPPLWSGASLLLASALLARLVPRSRLLFLASLGLFWAQIHAAVLLHAPFPDDLARAPLSVEGRIVSIPTDTEQGQRFLFAVERTRLDGTDLSFAGRVRLSCYQDCPDFRAGERWRLAVRLKPRHGYMNPGGFDYERWLFEQGIKATGHLRGSGPAERLDAAAGRDWLTRWRQALAGHLARVLGDSSQVGLIQALTIGERAGIEREVWDIFTRTGTNHLVAISGLHVGLVAGGLFLVTRRLWSMSTRLTLVLAAPKAAAIAGALAALGYAGLAGFAVSTQRALIMLAVVLGSVVWQRTLRPYHALTLALVGVLVWDPGAVLSYGFWLSFGAVALLLFNLGQRLPSRDLWTRWGRAQWAVGIGLLPLLFLFFGQASLVAPPVNLVAVPLFSLVILPLVLIASLLSLIPGLDWPLRLTAEGLDLCLAGLEWVADLPWASGHLAARPSWVWGVALLGALLVLAPRGLPGRWLGLVLLLPLLAVRPPAPRQGEVWFTLLDVGQGLAAVVETASGTLVYDTGPAYPSGFETGTMVLAPFLQSRGIERIERLVISHADKDHAGGAAGLLASIPAGRILSGEPERLGLAKVEPCLAGEGWEWSGVRFGFLYPERPGVKGNNASCVLKIETGGRSILLTGDVEAKVERELAERLGPGLRSDVLVAGHHGSATSTSAPFLDAVDPDWVLFSSGYANQFGFPVAEVRARVAERGIASLDTAIRGAIQIRLGPDGWIGAPEGWRDRAARLWTHRPGPSP